MVKVINDLDRLLREKDQKETIPGMPGYKFAEEETPPSDEDDGGLDDFPF